MVLRRSKTVAASAVVLAGAASMLFLPGGCGLIDEDRVDCPEEVTLTYSLDLISNKDEEMDLKLGREKDLPLRLALEDYLKGIFVDKAHDVDLSFYNLRQAGDRTDRITEIIDAGRREYDIRLVASDYQHLGVANLTGNGPVILAEDEKAETAMLTEDALAATTVESHRTGIFSARKRMLIRKDESQHFDAHLYMANDAAALILNVDSCVFRSIRADYQGLADRFRINDSTYFWDRQIHVAADLVDVEPYLPRVSNNGPSYIWAYDEYWELWERTPVMLCAVGFPSRNVGTAVIGTTPYIWAINLYVELLDGTTTLSQLFIGEPLPASHLMIIKGWLDADGSFKSRPSVPVIPDPTPGPDGPNPPTPPTPPEWVDVIAGVNVTLNWKEGAIFNPEL